MAFEKQTNKNTNTQTNKQNKTKNKTKQKNKQQQQQNKNQLVPLRGLCTPNQKLALFCMLSQNYQSFFFLFFCKIVYTS